MEKELNNFKFSIIMPAFNTENFIYGSISSVFAQTYENYELIIVDDGSTDKTEEVIKLICSENDKVKIVKQKNQGPAAARNNGLDNAEGDYVVFLDSDDSLEKNALEDLNKLINENGLPDIVVYGANCLPKDNVDTWLKNATTTNDKLYEKFSPDALFKEPGSKPFIWQNCLKLSFLNSNNLRINEKLHLGEDQAFQFSYFPLAKKILFTSKKFYNYRISRGGSLMDQYNRNLIIKASEHFRQVDFIIGEWLERGFMNKYKVEFYDWMVDFLGWSTITLPRLKLKSKYATRLLKMVEEGISPYILSYENQEVIKQLKEIAATNSELKLDLEYLKEEKKRLEKEYDDLIHSQSYRIGKIFAKKGENHRK